MKLAWTLLFLAPIVICNAQAPAPPFPESVQAYLRRYREQDDLSGWIYEQVQWVAAAPALRSAALIRAVGEAWRSPQTEAENQAWLDLLTNEGYSLLFGGAILPSTDAYTAAYNWARRHPEIVDPASMLENILKPLGNNYTRLGDYEQALFIHQKALAIALEGADKNALAGAYSNIANTCSNMGQARNALEYCRKGLAVAHSPLSGLLLSEQADAYRQMGHPEEARESIVKSIGILQRATGGQRDVSYWLLMAYQQAGDIDAADPRAALRYYDQALSLQIRLLHQQGAIRQREQAKLFQRMSALFVRLHQDVPARAWSDRCLAVLLPGREIYTVREEDLYAENTLADLLYTRAGLAKAADSTDLALWLYQLYFATEKKLRQALLTGSSRQAVVADTRPQYEEALGLAWAAWEKTKAEKYQRMILDLIEGSRAQLLLDEILQQRLTRVDPADDSLETRLRLLENARIYYEKENLRSAGKDSAGVTDASQEKQINWELAELRKKLGAAGPGNDAVLSRAGFSVDSLGKVFQTGETGRLFFLGRSALYTAECDHKGVRFIDKQPLPEHWSDSLRQFVNDWFQHGANAMLDFPGRYCQQAYALYQTLFKAHPLEPGKAYIIFPDGALSLLPVEALVTSDDCPPSPAEWPFVIKRTAISYAWSLNTLAFQQGQTGVPAGFSGFFLSGNRGTSPLLAAVEKEEGVIREAISGGNWYADSQATTGRFRQALETSAIVHISSHAGIRRNGIDAPHIELYDDPFYLFELRGLGAHPALVVLSACRTGDGQLITGEGVQSLARAFTAGGTNAIVAGGWNLNDETTAQLMGNFYSELVRSEDGNAAAALRKAKLGWLEDRNIAYMRKLPYFWAGLGYQGNPDPLGKGFFAGDHRRQEQGRWWYLFLVPVVFFIVWAYARGRRGHTPR